MSQRFGIHTGGNWIVDKLNVIDTYPRQDALANILEHSTCNGGSPFNVLVDLARLGASFSLEGIGLVGNDDNGRWVIRECARFGIDASQLRMHDTVPTSHTEVMMGQKSGRRTFFHHRGANAFLGTEHFDFTASSGKIFHLGYLLLLDQLDLPDPEFGSIAARVLHQAGTAGFKARVDVVSEDSGRFAGIVTPALCKVDYCILNELEIEKTTGISTRPDGRIDLKAIESASHRLLEAGVREWVIVHFPEGATALGKDGVFKIRGSFRVPDSKILGTVGGFFRRTPPEKHLGEKGNRIQSGFARDPGSSVFVGGAALGVLSRVRADFVFLGASGMDTEGCSTTETTEAERKMIMERSKRCILLSDSNKWRRPSTVLYGM